MIAAKAAEWDAAKAALHEAKREHIAAEQELPQSEWRDAEIEAEAKAGGGAAAGARRDRRADWLAARGRPTRLTRRVPVGLIRLLRRGHMGVVGAARKEAGVRGARYGCESSWRGCGGRLAALRRLALPTALAACCVSAAVTTAGAAGSNPNGSNYYRHRGGVVAWGDNRFGELGIGTTSGPQLCWEGACSAVPVGVSKLTSVQAVASGETHGLALIRNGHVWAWGNNAHGELGDNSTQASDVPVKVCAPVVPQTTQLASGCTQRLQEVTAVSAHEGDSLALLRNGTVVAWGSNNHGQLGDGSTADSDVPVTVCAAGETAAPCVHPLSGVVAISAGDGFALALLGDGTVVGWGENEEGGLGDGGTTASSVPVPVSGLGDVKAIAAGSGFGVALQRDGTVMTWGWIRPTYDGPLYSYTPVPVEGLPSNRDRRRRWLQAGAARQRHGRELGRQRRRPARRLWGRVRDRRRLPGESGTDRGSERSGSDLRGPRQRARTIAEWNRDGVGQPRVRPDRQ